MVYDVCLITGAVVWFFILTTVAFLILWVIYELIGAAIMTRRCIRVCYANGADRFSTKRIIRFWWYLAFGDGTRGHWTLNKTGEQVKWPWLWYNSRSDIEYYAG